MNKKNNDNNSYFFDGENCYLTVKSKKNGVFVVVIDSGDFDRVKCHTWSVHLEPHPYFYASMGSHRTGTHHSISLHRLITSFDWKIVDHINNDNLNNKKSNLRGASHSQNLFNRKGSKKKFLSEWKGVYRHSGKKPNPYYSRIQAFNKDKCLGSFKTPLEAATAYNEAAVLLHGEFAKLNDLTLYEGVA